MVNVRAREEREPKIKIGGKSWLIDALIKSMFSISMSFSNFKIWLDLNKGLECESLGWKFITLKAFLYDNNPIQSI